MSKEKKVTEKNDENNIQPEAASVSTEASAEESVEPSAETSAKVSMEASAEPEAEPSAEPEAESQTEAPAEKDAVKEPPRHNNKHREGSSGKVKNSVTRQELLDAVKSHRVASHVIDGVAEYPEDENSCGLCAIIQVSDMKILIPAEKLLCEFPKHRENEDPAIYRKRVKSNLDAMVSAKISFTITGVEKDKNIAYGDRLAAMEHARNHFYHEKNADGKTIAQMFTEGHRLVTCHVISVSAIAMHVELWGLEVPVFVSDACWRYTPKLSSVFTPGMKVSAYIKSLSAGEGGKIDLKLSVKEATPNTFAEDIKCFGEGECRKGLVIGKSKRKDNILIVKMGTQDHNIDVSCSVSRDLPVTPEIDDEVFVKLLHFYEDTGNVYGVIVRVIASSHLEDSPLSF